MHRFLELFTVAAFLATAAHAVWMRGRRGALLVGAMLWMGMVREGFVAVRRLLYEIDEGAISIGPTPLIAGVIWAFSIYAAVVFAEELTGRRAFDGHRPTATFYLLVTLFMVALVGFYEPFLGRVGLARWEEGTRVWNGVPWIALVGYPSLAVPFLALFRSCGGRREDGPRRRGLVLLAVGVTALAVAHAWGLQELKRLLGW